MRPAMTSRLAVSPMVATVAAPCDNGDIVLMDLSGGVVAVIARSAAVRARCACVAHEPAAHAKNDGVPRRRRGRARATTRPSRRSHGRRTRRTCCRVGTRKTP